jgi:cardiolipin synthase (CMP-forming)
MNAMKMRVVTVPNALTLLRFLAIPVLAWLISSGDRYNLVAFILFALIWLTDFLDGFIARHFHQVSEFGKLFDPFVDKLFQLATAVAMYRVGRLPYWVPLFIFIREMIMIIGSLILYQKQEIVVFAKWYGKLATGLFVAAFTSLFFIKPANPTLAGLIFIVPVVFSLYAYARYGASFIRMRLQRKKDPTKPDGSTHTRNT